MTISVGEKLPDATLVRKAENGFEEISLSGYLEGRKVVLFALPGAFTGVCTTSHLPSFMRNADAFAEKGVDEIICVSVNDPFVMEAWSEATGAGKAGITMLADSAAELTKALGKNFSVPTLGFYDRSNRYALVAEDGVVTHAMEDEPNTCDLSRGEQLLEAMG